MFIEYNPNPNNSRVGDCVIRAIAKAENISWDKIYLDLCVYGLMCSDLPISNNVWGRYLNDRNYKYIAIPNTCPFCYRIKDFCNDHPKGIFVLGTGTHAICIIDGNYYDSWDSGDEVPKELNAKDDIIANLRTQLNMQNLAASQTAQTAQLLADNSRQTAVLEDYLNPTARPAYIVQNPNCCPTQNNCGINCGCGVA